MPRAVQCAFVLVSLLAAVCLPARGQGQSGDHGPNVGQSTRHDLSPPLRTMRPLPPRRGPNIRVMPEPGLTELLPQDGLFAVEDEAVQTEVVPGPQVLTPPSGFEGQPNLSGVLPPDTNGDVGPAHYVQMVNSTFQIWTKAGASVYGPADLSTLWQGFGPPCSIGNDGDPVVLYDGIADRWILSQFVATAPYGECIAISQTGDPTGAYYRYFFQLSPSPSQPSSNIFYDYPHFGVWPDGYYAGFNKFNGNTYAGAAAIVFERPQMLNGLTARFVEFQASNGGTLLPSDLDGATLPPAGSPNFFAQRGAGLNIYQFHVDWANTANSTFSAPTSIPVTSYNVLCQSGFSLPPCVPQPNTSQDLDSLADRLMHRFAYRKFPTYAAMVVTHSVKVGNGGSAHGGVRWYEIRRADSNGALTLQQDSTYSPDSDWRWMGSVAMDNGGNLGLGYSVSSTSTFPSIKYTGHLSQGPTPDPVNTMRAEQSLKDGSGSQLHTEARWGDYAAMSVDPVDDCTFWFTSEYLSATSSADWKTWIGSFKFTECVPVPKGTVSGTVRDADGTGLSGVLVSASSGQSTLTGASGAYSLIMPPGTYTITADGSARNCSAPVSQTGVVVTANTTTTVDLNLSGDDLLVATAVNVSDPGGNNNGKVNKNECDQLTVMLRNKGCATAHTVSGTLSTATAGVTITTASSSWADIPSDATVGNSPVFDLTTAPSFSCGAPIGLSLPAFWTGGSNTFNLQVPTCQATTVYNAAIAAGDSTMSDRPARSGPISSCGDGKVCAGALGTTGTYRYDSYTFQNTSSTANCYSVTLAPGVNCTIDAGTELHSSAYLGTFTPANVCSGRLADSGFSSDNPVTYSFNLAAGATSTVIVNVGQSNALCDAYTLTMPAIDQTDAGGCASCDPATPSPTASNDGPKCAGQTVQLSATTVTGATYSWTGPGGFTSTDQNPTVPNALGGVYSVVAIENGCPSAPATTSVTVNPIPGTPTASNGGPYCEGATIQLSTPTVSGATYAWTGPNGFTSSQQNPAIANATTANAGQYSVTVTVNGCPSQAGTTSVTVNASPDATITAPVTVCPTSTGNVASVPSAGAGATYSWSITNGTITAGAGTSSITFTAGAGPVQLDVTVTNGNGCGKSGSTTIPLNTSPPAFAGATSATLDTPLDCRVNVTWSAATPSCGGVTYDIYRSPTPNFTPGPIDLVAIGVTGTSFHDNSNPTLTAGTTYEYAVFAIDTTNGAVNHSAPHASIQAGSCPAGIFSDGFEGGAVPGPWNGGKTL